MTQFARLTPFELKEQLQGKPKTPCAYILRHKASGKFYIGSTGNMHQRLERHLRDLNKGIHHNTTLQDLYTDETGLLFDVLWSDSRDEVLKIEQSLLDQHHGTENCLNLGDAAVGAWKVVPDRIRRDIAERMRGNTFTRGRRRSDEEKLAISLATRAAVAGKPGPNAGKNLSEETKQRLSAAKSNPLSVRGVFYNGTADAVKALGIPYKTLKNRLASVSQTFSDWFYVDKQGNRLSGPMRQQKTSKAPELLDPLILPT